MSRNYIFSPFCHLHGSCGTALLLLYINEISVLQLYFSLELFSSMNHINFLINRDTGNKMLIYEYNVMIIVSCVATFYLL
jgi:hypothetical protein